MPATAANVNVPGRWTHPNSVTRRTSCSIGPGQRFSDDDASMPTAFNANIPTEPTIGTPTIVRGTVSSSLGPVGLASRPALSAVHQAPPHCRCRRSRPLRRREPQATKSAASSRSSSITSTATSATDGRTGRATTRLRSGSAAIDPAWRRCLSPARPASSTSGRLRLRQHEHRRADVSRSISRTFGHRRNHGFARTQRQRTSGTRRRERSPTTTPTSRRSCSRCRS